MLSQNQQNTSVICLSLLADIYKHILIIEILSTVLPVVNPVCNMVSFLWYTGWRKKNACPLASTLTRFVCLWFLSLGLPQIKSLRSKISYSRRSESFHSRRNCNCATRNVSKCDAELWGEAPDVCTARRTPSFRYNFL